MSSKEIPLVKIADFKDAIVNDTFSADMLRVHLNEAEKQQMAAIEKLEDINPDEARHRYYNTPQWGMLKSLRMEMAKGACESETCSESSRLRLHHLNYLRLYREKFSDVQILCAGCHARTKGKKIVTSFCEESNQAKGLSQPEQEPQPMKNGQQHSLLSIIRDLIEIEEIFKACFFKDFENMGYRIHKCKQFTPRKIDDKVFWLMVKQIRKAHVLKFGTEPTQTEKQLRNALSRARLDLTEKKTYIKEYPDGIRTVNKKNRDVIPNKFIYDSMSGYHDMSRFFEIWDPQATGFLDWGDVDNEDDKPDVSRQPDALRVPNVFPDVPEEGVGAREDKTQPDESEAIGSVNIASQIRKDMASDEYKKRMQLAFEDMTLEDLEKVLMS